MGIFLDGKPIQDRRRARRCADHSVRHQGQGPDHRHEADRRAEPVKLLKAGAFPVPLKVVQSENVDATLGQDSVQKSVIAGETAMLVIMLFMVLYYRLPGLIAAVALSVYATIVLAVFKLWPVTLTLSGIAAFVLSVGMAVDANILIFERMKEELRIGRSLVVALEEGFNRAWSSIRDSNVSTLITCAILLLVRRSVRRQPGQGLRPHAGDRCSHKHVLGDPRHAHLPANRHQHTRRRESRSSGSRRPARRTTAARVSRRALPTGGGG